MPPDSSELLGNIESRTEHIENLIEVVSLTDQGDSQPDQQ